MDLPAQFIAGVSSSGFISVGKHGRCSSVTSRGEARGDVCAYKPHAVPGPPSESPPSFSLQSGKGLSSRTKC